MVRHPPGEGRRHTRRPRPDPARGRPPRPGLRHDGRAPHHAGRADRADHERRAADVGRRPGGAPRPAAATPVTFADPLPRRGDLAAPRSGDRRRARRLRHEHEARTRSTAPRSSPWPGSTRTSWPSASSPASGSRARHGIVRPRCPPADRGRLIATFSGGFRLGSSHGGMILGGQVQRATRDGAATLAIDARRRAVDRGLEPGHPGQRTPTTPSARTWTSSSPTASRTQRSRRTRTGSGASPARPTTSSSGGPAPASSPTAPWCGSVVPGSASRRWPTCSSGSARCAPCSSTSTTSGCSSTPTATVNGAVHGSRLLKDMRGPDDRWLSQDTRDFFAVFARP